MTIFNSNNDRPVDGLIKAKFTVDLDTLPAGEDFVDSRGFILQAIFTTTSGGGVIYRPLASEIDLEEVLYFGSDFVRVAGVPVLCSAIRRSSELRTFSIGFL